MKTAHHSERRFVPRRPHGRLLASLTALLLVAAAWGCFGGNRTTTLPFQYSLEYASPRFDDLPPLDAALSLERFSSAQGINKTAMIYRSEPYRYDAYYGHYWRSRPRDLATDFLLRDLKYARLFKAVFSYQDRQETRFVLQGAVTECGPLRAAGRPTGRSFPESHASGYSAEGNHRTGRLREALRSRARDGRAFAAGVRPGDQRGHGNPLPTDAARRPPRRTGAPRRDFRPLFPLNRTTKPMRLRVAKRSQRPCLSNDHGTVCFRRLTAENRQPGSGSSSWRRAVLAAVDRDSVYRNATERRET